MIDNIDNNFVLYEYTVMAQINKELSKTKYIGQKGAMERYGSLFVKYLLRRELPQQRFMFGLPDKRTRLYQIFLL